MTKTYLSAGYELANINDCGDVTPGESLPFMPVAPSGVGNLVGRMRDLVVIRLQPFNETEFDRALEIVGEDAPHIVGKSFVQFLVLINGPYRVASPTFGGVSVLQSGELRACALLPPSRLLLPGGGFDVLKWRDENCTVPTLASPSLVRELIVACRLPHGAERFFEVSR